MKNQITKIMQFVRGKKSLTKQELDTLEATDYKAFVKQSVEQPNFKITDIYK